MSGRLLSPKVLVLGDQVLVSAGNFFTQLLLARGLGLEGYGYFSFIVLTQLFLLSLQQSGLTGVACVIYPPLEEREKSSYLGGVFGIQGTYLLLVAAVCAGYWLLFDHRLSPADALAAGTNIIFFLFQDFIRKLLILKNKLLQSFLISTLNYGLQIALIALFLYRGRLNFSMALWICALTFIPSLLAGIIVLRPAGINPATTRQALLRSKDQSGWMLLSALLQWLGGNFYIVAAGWWLGPAALGALRLSQYLFGLLNVLLQAVENYAMPRAAALHAPHEVMAYARIVFKKMAAATFPALLIMAALTQPLLQWLGKTNAPLAPGIIYGFAGLYVLITIGYPVRLTLRALHLNKAYFTGYVLTTGISLATAYVFIHTWAEAGVVAGLILSQVVLLAFWLWTIRNKMEGAWKSFT